MTPRPARTADSNALVVVVPTVHHFTVARDFLLRGIPLLVEKPLTNEVAQADHLVALAAAQNVVLQVGHIERFNPAFEELASRPLQPKFVVCERLLLVPEQELIPEAEFGPRQEHPLDRQVAGDRQPSGRPPPRGLPDH